MNTTPRTETRSTRKGRSTRTRHSGAHRQLTDAEAADLSLRVSHDPILLDGDDLACRDCGVVVTGPVDLADVVRIESDRVRVFQDHTSPQGHSEPMTTCSDCVRLREIAAEITALHASKGLTNGGLRLTSEIAAELIHNALCAFDAAGKQMPDPERLDASTVQGMVRHISPTGLGLKWSNLFGPTLDATRRSANPVRWAHWRESERRAVKVAYIDTLAERLSAQAPPVKLAPPTVSADNLVRGVIPIDGGCMFCGISTQSMPAREVVRHGGIEAAAKKVWGRRTNVKSDSLGGRRSPMTFAGHLCTHCLTALNRVGAIGPTARERAIIEHLGLTHRWGADYSLNDSMAWGGLVASAKIAGSNPPAANTSPWAHLGNLSELGATL